MKILLSILFVLFGLILGLDSQATTSHTNLKKDELQHMLDTWRTDRHIPGMLMSIRIPNPDSGTYDEFTYASGEAIRDKAPMTPDYLLPLGGNTQNYLVALALRLAAEEKLSLEDKVSKWVPEYRPWRAVTLQQLLQHTSGIPDYQDEIGFRQKLKQNPIQQWAPKQLFKFALKKSLLFPPGTNWHYSHTDSVLLGTIIERATKKPLKELFDTYFFQPEKLMHTHYISEDYPDTIKKQLAHGYVQTENGIFPEGADVTDVNLSSVNASGAMVGSAEDLRRWTEALWHGRVLPDTQLTQMKQLVCMDNIPPCQAGKSIDPNQLAADSHAYGLGVRAIRDGNYRAHGLVWWHGFGDYGYQGSFFYWPRFDAVMVILGNSFREDTQDYLPLAQGVLKMFLG